MSFEKLFEQFDELERRTELAEEDIEELGEMIEGGSFSDEEKKDLIERIAAIHEKLEQLEIYEKKGEDEIQNVADAIKALKDEKKKDEPVNEAGEIARNRLQNLLDIDEDINAVATEMEVQVQHLENKVEKLDLETEEQAREEKMIEEGDQDLFERLKQIKELTELIGQGLARNTPNAPEETLDL